LKPVKFEELLAKLAAAMERRVSRERKSGRP
jgi:hypothetical protein